MPIGLLQDAIALEVVRFPADLLVTDGGGSGVRVEVVPHPRAFVVPTGSHRATVSEAVELAADPIEACIGSVRVRAEVIPGVVDFLPTRDRLS